MKSTLKLIILAATALITTSFAFNNQQQPVPYDSQPVAYPQANLGTGPGFYLGFGFGYGRMHTPKLPNSISWNFPGFNPFEDVWTQRNGVAGRLYLGYLWQTYPDLQLGLETGYTTYTGSFYSITYGFTAFKNITWTYHGHNIDLLGVAKYRPSNDRVSLIFKAGGAYVTQIFSGSKYISWLIPYSYKSVTSTAILPKAAIGIGLDFNKHLGMNLIVDHIFGSEPETYQDRHTLQKSTNKIASVTTVLLSYEFHF